MTLVDDEPAFGSPPVKRAKRAKPRAPLESEITAEVIAWLKTQPGCHARKLYTGGAMGETGHPDIDGCINGRSIKIEMKRPKEKPRLDQMNRLREWCGAGAIAGWATSLDEAKALVARSLADPAWRNPLTGPGVP